MPHLKINRKLEPFLTTPKPIKVAVGGRGSGKSIGIGDMLTFKMDTEKADIYCLREFQDSINDSVHRVFVDSIEKRLCLKGWDIQENKVVSSRGARTNYKGAARNPDSIQSAQGYKYSWFEEAHRASKTSLDKLLPTIIRNPGAECWFSANPQSSNDAFSQRFITPYQRELDRNGYYEDDIHLIIVVNWRDNPWWNAEQEALRKWDYENRPRAEYDWIWEGKFNDSVDNSIIRPEWFDSCVDAHVKLNFKPSGAKIISHDPSDTGSDPKGLAFRHGSVFLDVQEKAIGDVNEGCDWATGYAVNVNADLYTWDCDGMGVSLNRQTELNLKSGKVNIAQFKGSHSPDDGDKIYEAIENNYQKQKTNSETFYNKRAQYYWKLRDRCYKTHIAVTTGAYTNPDEMVSFSSAIENIELLRSQICRIPLKPNGSGKIQILSKPEMKKLGIESPNMADAVMMGMITPDISNKEITSIDFDGW